MTYFIKGVDSQETETLEVDSEGEKLRRELKEQNVNLSDQSLTNEENTIYTNCRRRTVSRLQK